jgi:hypothetical protein
MAGIVVGNGTAASAEATVDTNGDLHVRTPQTQSKAGFSQLSCEIDSGSITASRYVKALEASSDFRLRVGMDQPLFSLGFEGTIQARDRYQQTDNTMTCAQASGFLTLNSAASAVTTINTRIQTYRMFPLFGSYALAVEMWGKVINETATNSATEFGVGYVSAATAPTDGVFFRYNAGGQLMGVVSYGGTETTVNLTSPTTNVCHHWTILIHNEEVEFWINDILYGEVATPTSNPAPMQSVNQPFFARIYNSGAASAARQLSIGHIDINLMDANSNKMWGHAMCGMGGGAYQIQPGTTSGPTVTRGAAQTGWPTSGTAQTAPTYTATSAPATNSLGGHFLTAAYSTMATDADYPVYSYLNPVGTSTLPGKTLYITGFRQGEIIVAVANATAASTWRTAIGIGSTSPNTTATEGAAVIAARIIPVGSFWAATTQAIGTTYGGVSLDFSHAPLVCPPGTYVQFIMRPSGAVLTNTLQLAGTVTFIGYHE